MEVVRRFGEGIYINFFGEIEIKVFQGVLNLASSSPLP